MPASQGYQSRSMSQSFMFQNTYSMGTGVVPVLMEVLADVDSMAKRRDPSGESSMHLAKRLRLDVIRNRIPGDYDALVKLAEESFGLPAWKLSFWEKAKVSRPWLSGGHVIYSG